MLHAMNVGQVTIKDTGAICIFGTNFIFHNFPTEQETHIIHKFKDDFYGAILKVCLVGWIRAECSFSSLGKWTEYLVTKKSDT